VAERSALPPELSADDAIAAVMCLLTERLTAGEAHDLLEAVPKGVRPFFERCVVHREGKPVRKLDHAEFLDRVAKHLGVTPAHAERICQTVFEAIRAELSDEVVANVGQQLPRGLKQLWLGEPPPSVPVPAPLSDEEARRAVEEHIDWAVDLPPDVTAADAFTAVMCVFSRRLSGGEARDLLLSLPQSLRGLVDRCMVHRPEPCDVFDRDELLREVARHLHVDAARAGALVRATFAGIKRLIPTKAVHDVSSQLPVDLRELWDES
jgi:uncharacterized protein (DUF2267 family)